LNPKWTVRLRRVLTVVGTSTAAVLALALPAAAHTPIILDGSDVVPWTAPRLYNGDSNASFFGSVPNDRSWRTYQFTISDTTRGLDIATLVPDLAPENTYDADDLPTVLVITPDYKVITIKATERTVLPVPALGHTYLKVAHHTGPSVAGTYSVLIGAGGPARFQISHGHHGVDWAGIEDAVPASLDQIQQWYNTAP
jgi:hypothetical protein